MVNGVTLYKGGGPANFGGRISSILDVTLKNGDAGRTKVTGGVGYSFKSLVDRRAISEK